jgi:hypothetical protein
MSSCIAHAPLRRHVVAPLSISLHASSSVVVVAFSPRLPFPDLSMPSQFLHTSLSQIPTAHQALTSPP